MSLNKLSIFELQNLIHNKEITASELAKDCIAQITNRDKEVKAWIDFQSSDAFKNAKFMGIL